MLLSTTILNFRKNNYIGHFQSKLLANIAEFFNFLKAKSTEICRSVYQAEALPAGTYFFKTLLNSS